MRNRLAFPAVLLLLSACRSTEPPRPATPAPAGGVGGSAARERPEWAIAIHGGAGTIARTMPEAVKQEYRDALTAALTHGVEMLRNGASALDTAEAVVVMMEEDPHFNAGKGAVYTHDGTHELDASIMDGRDRSAGAVGAVRTVRNPIKLARMVMERSPHVFLVGDGAEAFADRVGLERVENSWFDTDRRRHELDEELDKERRGESEWQQHGTVGATVLDRAGHLAAATSTGGRTNKRFGRIGDTPVIGAGTWADDATCAVSGTGKGEQFLRHTVAVRISDLMAYRGLTLQQAAEEVVHRVLQPQDGGVVAVAHDGSIAQVYNSEGMFRGAADARGRFQVAIWEQ
jgi:beta-aspartyl-peptidase (threonine type)